MRLHSDKLTRADLWASLPDGCDLEVTSHGSRKRDHAFEVGLSAETGTDVHGIKRCYSRNSGQYGARDGEMYGDGYTRAATYIEWGDWMVALFKIDPNAIIGPYDGAEGFVRDTQRQAEFRPKRENAKEHADRWDVELTLEYLRGELRAERISYGELAELESLRDKIDPGDVELLEAAGVPEDEAMARRRYRILRELIAGADRERGRR